MTSAVHRGNRLSELTLRPTSDVFFNNQPLRRAALLLIISSLLACNAFARSITIFNTGESNGVAMPVGQMDPHYSLISAPPTVPLTAITTLTIPPWTPNTATADWISPGASGYINWPVGLYDYRTTFSLAGLIPNTAQLSGMWASDNDACIFLNGMNTGVCTPFQGFGALAAFSITSGFRPGINTLDLMVDNGGAGLATGTIVEISGTANPTVPEPSSLALLGTGIAACLQFRRSRSKQQQGQ